MNSHFRGKATWSLRIVGAFIAIAVAYIFGFYPAFQILRLTVSESLRERGQVAHLDEWFCATAQRYDRWASDYRQSKHASKVQSEDVAGTEWPLFGSVFYLLSAEELLKSGQIKLSDDVRASLLGAASVVADPVTATWVKNKWGTDYLEKENLFYRMLVVLGLDSYQKMTGDRSFESRVTEQARGLAQELRDAPFHVVDDYPGECYPTDVIWATAAIGRVDGLSREERTRVGQLVMASMAGPLADKLGLPAMRVDARTGEQQQASRGCSNSGLLSFAYEVSPELASRWYSSYEAHFWKRTPWVSGFREHPLGTKRFSDVDSGPILFDIGTAASLFGIGAARIAGRFDQAAPMTMEAVAAAWPTPFGLFVPALMGSLAVDSSCLGETAFLFAMTRPNYEKSHRTYQGPAPLIVYGIIAFYALLGVGLLARETHYWLGRLRAAPTR